MDNLTHSLTGWALGQAGLKTKSRKGLAALILGANAPDIDVFFQWAPWEPLATHRGFSHSLIGGVLLLPLALWGLLLALDRWQVARGTTFKSGLAMNRWWLLALCTIGAISHSLLDLQTTYSVQLFSPLSGRWHHNDSLFIIDWVLWLLLGGSIILSRRMEKEGGRDHGPLVRAALGIVVVYICANLGLSGAATARVKARHPEATAIFASPPPFVFWRRDMVWREGSSIGRSEWDIIGGLRREQKPQPDGMSDPIVALALRKSPGLRKFLYWSVLPVATVTRDGCLATVSIGDARYGSFGSRQSRLSRETLINHCA